MLFNFYGNQHLFLALARSNGHAMGIALQRLPQRTNNQQLLNFLRHHDELSLALLGGRDAQTVINAFAPDEDMLIYRTGIRRRLAPMVDNNQRILRMVHSLLFSLPGSVMLRYGDEIGMGDDLSLKGRMSVRTPMQWSAGTHAGFSNGRPKRLVHPLIDRGEYSYKNLNVLEQQRDPDSLLNFIERLITTRRQNSEIGHGEAIYVDAGRKELLIHGCVVDTVAMGFVHNFSDQVITVPLPVRFREQQFSKVFCDSESYADSDVMIVSPYGFLWLKMEPNPALP
jgi:maltose alpha-D-glucosyltransferase/alpha-amylase